MISNDRAAELVDAHLAATMRRAELVRRDGDEAAVDVLDALLSDLAEIADEARESLKLPWRGDRHHVETGRNSY